VIVKPLDRIPLLYHTRVREYDPEAVTRISAREEPPETAGLRKSDVDAIWSSVVTYYKRGLNPAMQLCIRRGGHVILDRSIGHRVGNAPTDPPDAEPEIATPDTLFNFFSGSKAITAMLVHLLHEQGLIHIDEPVATFIPEFGRHRKHRITVKDVLSHHAGIPAAPTESINLDYLADSDRLLEAICDLRPVHRPGMHPAYHALTGGFIFGEIIKRVTGADIRAYITKYVREPLGFQHLNYGVAPEDLGKVAMNAFTGPEPVWPAHDLLMRALGKPMRELVDISNDPRFLTGIVPAGNIIATANEVSRFFEILLNMGTLDGVQIFKARTVASAVRPVVRGKIDRMLFLPVPYSAGFMLSGKHIGFYGPHTPEAYGHLGFTNVLGWADPERDLSACFMTSGKPFITAELLVWMNVMRTIAVRIPRDMRSAA
jgi:CubicO group peptidase (beta-lactamase class C family)